MKSKTKIRLTYGAILIVCAGFLLSCGTTGQFSPGKGNKYQYSFKLVYPVENSNLLFQDDNVIVQFKFDEAAIRYQLQNVSDSRLTIEWNKAAMSINGRYTPIRHSSTLYGDTMRSESISMPPLGYIRDIAIPHENVYLDGDRWVEEDLFPTTDRNSPEIRESIQKSVSQRVGLTLPMVIGSEVKQYEFDFQVESVKRIPWKDYVPFKRVPSPPHPKQGVLALDNVTTAIIAVGVLGFSAYILSVKKNPPSE
jgi:hypothetical protein